MKKNYPLVALSILLTMQAFSQNRLTINSDAPNLPFIGQLKHKYEVIENRNRFSKTFKNTDGTFSLYTTPGSLHYASNNGWEEIGVAINPNTTGLHTSNPYYNGDNSFKTYYPQHPVNGSLFTRLKEGEISEKLEAVYAEDINGNAVFQYSSNATAGVQVDGSKITYTNLFPYANLSYTQGSDGRKLDLVIKDQQFLKNLPANAQFLVLKEKITLPNSWTVSENEYGLNVYAAGKWMANIPQPVATETISPLKSYENDNGLMVTGEVSKSLNGNILTVLTKFPVSWLRHSSRNFPLSLDPTTFYYPNNVSMTTGNMTGPGATAKTSGNIRLGGSGSSSWATFNIATLPVAATITTATMLSLHYSGTGAVKYCIYSGMGNIYPSTALNTDIYNKILAGPVYNSSDTFGATTANTWYPTALNGSALTDIAAQQSQGWTAVGMLYLSGNTGTMFHYGYNAAVATNKPYLVLNYSTTSCSGTPTAGTPTGPSLACGVPFNLTLSGNSAGSGLSFQWQSRPVGGGAWINMGASQAFPLISASQTTSTQYRCFLTCSGSTDTSAAITVNQDLPSNCYCIPSGPVVGTHYISGFSTTNAVVNISNTGTGYSTTSAGYSNFTNLIVHTNPGSTVNFSITFVSPTHYIGVYADWNQDGDFFDSGDTIIYSNVAYNSPFNGSFTVPLNALAGNTRLRIRTASGSQAPPCDSILNGETEEYTINILPSGPHDPTITSIGAPLGNICTDSSVTLSATICNYGSANITTSPLVKVAVQYRVTGPLGLIIYNDTLPNGLTLGQFGTSCQNSTSGPINMFIGGVYSINAVVIVVNDSTAPSVGNSFLFNDSLMNPIVITNYRPPAGEPYQLCQYGSIPFGQGLTVGITGAITTAIYDSVEISFNVTTFGLIDNVGATTTGTSQGPGNANCNNLYAGNLANALIPALPPGAYFTQPAKLTVTNLSSGMPNECRFILYKNNPSISGSLLSACPLGYNTGAGDIDVGGLSIGASSCFVNNRNISLSDVSAIFANPPGTILNVGYWETWNDLAASSDVTFNACGTTQIKLKIYFASIPTTVSWFDVPNGGSSLSSSSPFNPLVTQNALINNSDTAGIYTFYAAYNQLPACRIPVNLVINELPTSMDTITTCNSFIWLGDTYTSTGNYSKNIPNAYGCDSLYLLNLTVNNSTFSASAITACNSYTWPLNNLTYTSSGQYTATTNNTAGCDSIVTLNLLIKSSSPAFSQVVSAINSYTWQITNQTYTNSGVYVHSFTNNAGCDSLFILDLTINKIFATMTLQNVVQTAPGIFQYDVMLTNTGNTTLALQGYTCGINHANGMRNGGTLTQTFLSRDPLLSALPNVTAAYTSSTNHLRLLTANVTAGNEFNMAPGASIRLATMRVSNSVPFPADFVPALNLQTLIAIGKTPCVATCIATPPGSSYAINGTANTPSAGTLQALTGVVNTPCLYLNPSSAFAVTATQTTLSSCSASPNISAQVTVSGIGSTSLPGTYTLDGVPATNYSTTSFPLSNLSVGSHSITVTSGAGCTTTSLFTISQPIFSPSIVQTDTTICLGSTITLNAVTGVSGNNGLPSNLQNGLVAWFPFNGNANDISGNGNHGIVRGAALTTDRFGNANSAFQFIGNDNNTISYIVANHSNLPSGNSPRTISVWLTHSSYGVPGGSGNDGHPIVSYGVPSTNSDNELMFYTTSSGIPYARYAGFNNDLNIPFSYNLNTWYHMVATFDGSVARLYINNTQIGSGNFPNWNTVLDSIVIGTQATRTNFHNGKIDEIQIYNRVLSPLEIQQLFQLGNVTYLWSTGDTSSVINTVPSQTTTYFLTKIDNSGTCTDSVTVTVSNPSTSAGTNQSICLGDSITLSASSATSYSWSNSVVNGVPFTPISTQTYTVTGTNSFGCTATSQVTVTVNPRPNAYVAATGAATFCNGNSVVLNANGGNGLTYQWYKTGTPITGATSNSYQVNQSGNYWVQETNQYACSSVSNTQQVVVNNCDVSLDLKLFYQGYYAGMSTMAPTLMNEGVSSDPTVTDTILIDLHSPLPPYGLVRTKKAILHTDGQTLCTFEHYANNYYLADSYYVAIQHRNGLTTWSSNPVHFTSNSVSYDFTTASSRAYGDNMTEVEPGIWALFAGELNYDDNIDLLDNSIMENDIANFSFGYYSTDLNGDGNSDLLDVPILEMNTYNFVYSSQPPWSGTLPSVSTYPVTSITATTAVSGGSILSDGGSPILQKGVCWSLNPNPTTVDSKTSDGGGSGTFSSNLSNLSPSSTYYVRTYARNSVGTVYGNELVFITEPAILPTLNTIVITNITITSASSGGIISSDGGSYVTSRGVCWSTSSNPIESMSTKTINGSGVGSFTSLITGLSPNTTYYVRAYATNFVGTAYGNEISFTTSMPSLPSLSTDFPLSLSSTTAMSGGNVTNDGGAIVTERGVCWSTITNPTISLSTRTIDGNGLGAFTSLISGLIPNTVYYIRSYATNSVGTAYGPQVTLSLTIGMSYQGGKIAYIFKPQDPGYVAGSVHGLIAATSDQSTGIIWHASSSGFTGAVATQIGTGNMNTNTIVSHYGTENNAARLCYNLILNGYTDWYLPSLLELNEIYANRLAIGGFASANYWSSSEYDFQFAWLISFTNGMFNYFYPKESLLRVRAVRSF